MALKIGIINDVHYVPDKEGDWYGENSSRDLIEMAIERMEQVDVLIASGDFLKHGTAIKKNNYPDNKWGEIKEEMSAVVSLMKDKASTFLPLIGNNDVVYHY